MRSLINMIKNVVGFAKVTGGANNTAQFPVQQITYKGVTTESLCVFQYGTYANLPNDSLSVTFSIDGDESNKAMIGYTPQSRPDDLAQGEVAHYHPTTNSKVVFRNNGNVEIVVNGDSSTSVTGGQTVDITGTQTVNVSGDSVITVDGDVNLTASNVNVDASETNLGVGGQKIARLGDTVQVVGVMAGGATISGTITSGGNNTSI